MITLDIPNLDHEEPDELDELRKHLEWLAAYCDCTANAMRARRNGNVSTALKLEHRAQMLYELLPPSWRW
jgi:hypothetical protein